MGFDSGMHSLGLTLQVFFLDILLSGDNAIVIALACRRLPLQQMRQAILIGTGAAIALRILFTTMVTFLLAIPFLKLLGMLALITIAIKLLIDEDDGLDTTQSAPNDDWQQTTTNLRTTIGIIVVADVTMSLDNVVALAAISQNSVFYLVLGLTLSVPLLMYGSQFVARLLKTYPVLIPAGGALLGWIAGDIGMSDPLIAEWVMTQSPGLTLAMPLACAIFVLLESRIIQQNSLRLPRPILKRPVNQTLPVTQPVARLETIQPVDVSVVNISNLTTTDTTTVTRPEQSPSAMRLPSTSIPYKAAVYFMIAIVAVLILGVIVNIIYRSVMNEGLMPPPTQLTRYDCPGAQGAFQFHFRHGIEKVRIRSSAGELSGNVLKGKIEWANYSGDTALLGFTPPLEITWEDAKSVRLNGGSFLEVNCQKNAEGGAAP